jgi:hypothetical protein
VNERLAAARAYVEKKPSDKFGLYTLAMELRKEADWPSCFSAFDTLLAHHPDYGAAFYHYAVAARASGDRDRALGLLEQGRAACARSGDGKTAAEIDSLAASFRDEDDE